MNRVGRILIVSWLLNFLLLLRNLLSNPCTIIFIIDVWTEILNFIKDIGRIIWWRSRDRSRDLGLQIIRNGLPWSITDKIKGNNLIAVWSEGPATCKEDASFIDYLFILVIAFKFPSTFILKVHVSRLLRFFCLNSSTINICLCADWREGSESIW